MKSLLLVCSLLFFSATSFANEIYRCESPGRYFSVKKGESGEYIGTFQNFTGEPEAYDCVRTARGHNFKCTKDDYIVTIRRGASGQKVVDFELDGDFFPDSGYLFQISCDN